MLPMGSRWRLFLKILFVGKADCQTICRIVKIFRALTIRLKNLLLSQIAPLKQVPIYFSCYTVKFQKGFVDFLGWTRPLTWEFALNASLRVYIQSKISEHVSCMSKKRENASITRIYSTRALLQHLHTDTLGSPIMINTPLQIKKQVNADFMVYIPTCFTDKTHDSSHVTCALSLLKWGHWIAM